MRTTACIFPRTVAMPICPQRQKLHSVGALGLGAGTLAHADSSRPGTPVNYGTSGSGVASKGATNKQWTDYSFWNGCVSGTFTLMCFQQ